MGSKNKSWTWSRSFLVALLMVTFGIFWSVILWKSMPTYLNKDETKATIEFLFSTHLPLFCDQCSRLMDYCRTGSFEGTFFTNDSWKEKKGRALIREQKNIGCLRKILAFDSGWLPTNKLKFITDIKVVPNKKLTNVLAKGLQGLSNLNHPGLLWRKMFFLLKPLSCQSVEEERAMPSLIIANDRISW